MTTVTAGHRFEISHKSGSPEDPGLCSADDIAAYMLIDSVAISTATSKAVSTVNAVAPDSSSISQANSRATSAGTAASVADSKAVSDSGTTSMADSKAISVSGSCSVADSKAVSVSVAVPVTTAIVYSGAISSADSKAVSTANTIPTPAAGRTVPTLTQYLANNAVFNVLDYGAAFNGVTDDATAINAACAAALAAGGGIVQLPVGTAIYGSLVTWGTGVTVQGRGMGATILKQKASANLSTNLLIATSAFNAGAKDFTLDCNMAQNTGAGQNYGLRFDYGTDHLIDRVEVKNFYGLTGGTGVMIAGTGVSTRCHVTRCYVHDGGDIAALHQSDGIFVGGVNNKLTFNHIYNITDTAIVAEQSTDVLIDGNTILFCTQGIALGTATSAPGVGGTVSNNLIAGINRFNGQAILIYRFNGTTNKKILVAHNNIRDSTAGGGIFCWQSSFVDFVGNRASNIAGTAASAWDGVGLYVRNCHHITLNGGSYDGCSQQGVLFAGVTDATVIAPSITSCMLLSPGTAAGMTVQDGPTEPSWGAPQSVQSQRITIIGLRSTGTLAYANATAIIGATSIAINDLPGAIPSGTVLTFTGGKTATLSAPALAGATTLAVTALAAQVNAADVANYAPQGRGLSLSGLCDQLLIVGCDLRGNANNPGYSNAATGNVRRFGNLTFTTNNTNEAVDYADLVGGAKITGGDLAFVSGATGAIRYVSRIWSDTANWALLNNAATLANLLVDEATGSTGARGSLTSGEFAVTYSASMTPNAQLGNRAIITATNSTAFAINAPTNPVTGQVLRVTIRNTSGGALGVATWNAVFKMVAWSQPANGFSRSIEFDYDGTNWVEMTRTAADIPN